MYVAAEDNTESLRFDSQILVEKMKAGPPDCKTRKPVAQSRTQFCLDIVIPTQYKQKYILRERFLFID